MTTPIVLASASPGRCEVLRRTGIPFTVDPSDCDESLDAASPEEHVMALAMRKALAVAARHPDCLIIGADSVVELDGDILGKPGTPADARRMLGRLAGRSHRLLTGIAIVDSGSGKTYQGIEATLVHIRTLTDEQLDAYVASGEPMGKAGSYELQGLGAAIIDRIEGDFANVVGLPIAHLARALEDFGVHVLESDMNGAETDGRVR